MRIWNRKVERQDRVYLLPIDKLIVCLHEITDPRTPTQFDTSLATMGPLTPNMYSTLENAAKHFIGEYNGHIEVDTETLALLDLTTWVWRTEDALPALVRHLRSSRLRNEPVSDGENLFANHLGFREFYPSRHQFVQDNGRFPALIEGKVEVFPS